MRADPRNPEQILSEVFGHAEFRGQQAAVIEACLEGQDVVALFPTGFGKSICFQLPAVKLTGTTLVVSPLKALMRDQIDALRRRGVPCAALNGDLEAAEAAEAMVGIRRGKLKLLYMSPERIFAGNLLATLAGTRISRIAIDEAHCLSQWGDDFRTEYGRLGELRSVFPGVPVMALTATADAQTRDDMIERLGMADPKIFAASFDRPNIRLDVIEKQGAGDAQILAAIREHPPGTAGIVYRLSRKKVEETAAMLNRSGIPALPYHAKLLPSEREANQAAFLAGGVTIVATIAFGMGIDKPDIRYVIHGEIPSSPSACVQELGRAGRDGAPARSTILYGLQDVVQRRRMIDEGEAPERIKKIERSKMNALVGYCETASCRRQAILACFGEQHPGGCGNCDSCLVPATTYDGTTAAKKVLSAIYRTKERFGAQHIVDVLVGRPTPKMAQFGHDRLPTYGVGREMVDEEWMAVIRQLVVHGHLRVDHEAYGAYKIEPSAWSILRGVSTIRMRAIKRAERVAQPTARGTKTPRTARPPATPRTPKIPAAARTDRVEPADPVYDALRAERGRIARERSVPAYVVFNNATLKAIARAMPSTRSELRAIHGVGDAKLEQYGDMVLEIVGAHAEEAEAA